MSNPFLRDTTALVIKYRDATGKLRSFTQKSHFNYMWLRDTARRHALAEKLAEKQVGQTYKGGIVSMTLHHKTGLPDESLSFNLTDSDVDAYSVQLEREQKEWKETLSRWEEKDRLRAMKSSPQYKRDQRIAKLQKSIKFHEAQIADRKAEIKELKAERYASPNP